jgi:hypothetical protein
LPPCEPQLGGRKCLIFARRNSFPSASLKGEVAGSE